MHAARTGAAARRRVHPYLAYAEDQRPRAVWDLDTLWRAAAIPRPSADGFRQLAATPILPPFARASACPDEQLHAIRQEAANIRLRQAATAGKAVCAREHACRNRHRRHACMQCSQSFIPLTAPVHQI